MPVSVACIDVHVYSQILFTHSKNFFVISIENTIGFLGSFNAIGHVNWLSHSHNVLFWKTQTHSVIDSIYDIDLVFLENPVKNCIVGMLLTRRIVHTL